MVERKNICYPAGNRIPVILPDVKFPNADISYRSVFEYEDVYCYNPSLVLRALMCGKISVMGKGWSGRGRQEEQETTYPKGGEEKR
jgi:hypothetical protein